MSVRGVLIYGALLVAGCEPGSAAVDGGRRAADAIVAADSAASRDATSDAGLDTQTDARAAADIGAVADVGAAADAAVEPTFLDPASYADIVVLAGAFPFGVTGRFAADGAVLGSRWGRHGGPMVTSEVYRIPTGEPGVIRWTPPAGANGDMAKLELPLLTASGLPRRLYYGADGMVDLPFGALALLSYTGTDVPFPGEALVYDATDYRRLVSRAHVNGFYSGVGFGTDGVVYAGLSPVSGAPSGTRDNGLYVARLCGESLVASGTCPEPARLFAWRGSSGPVAVDDAGNAFVAAYLGASSASDAVMGVTAAQLAAHTPIVAVTVAEANTQGTSSLAVIAPRGDAPGWIVAKGFDAARPEPAYAQAFVVDTAVSAAGSRVELAIEPGPRADGFSVFAGDGSALWVAVERSAGQPRAEFLRLERRGDR